MPRKLFRPTSEIRWHPSACAAEQYDCRSLADFNLKPGMIQIKVYGRPGDTGGFESFHSIEAFSLRNYPRIYSDNAGLIPVFILIFAIFLMQTIENEAFARGKNRTPDSIFPHCKGLASEVELASATSIFVWNIVTGL